MGLAVLGAAEPTDPARHYLGMNANFATSWGSDHPFADVAKVSRMVTLSSWNAEPPTDPDGYPTTDFRWIFLEANARPGTYRLVFTGQATVTPILGTGSMANLVYDPGTNTTSADIIVPDSRAGGSGMIDFAQTRRQPGDAPGNGLTGIHIYQPGSPADGSKLLGEAFRTQVRRSHLLRVMNWQGANGNATTHWSERTRPGSFRGVSFEDCVRAANESDCDLWLCLPVKADDAYVRKIAQAVLYGTDGSEPYPAPVADPVHAPLAAHLNVYIEYGNEVWNSAAGFNNFYWIKAFADAVRTSPDPHPTKLGDSGDADQWVMLGRYWAWRAAECSKIIRRVAGDARMMARVRPVLECQIGGGWVEKMMPFLRTYYAGGRDPDGLHPVDHYFYGLGGTCYFYADESAFVASKDPADYMSHINWPHLSDLMASEAIWARDAGLRHTLYEGGNHPNGSSAITGAEWNQINAAPAARDMILECQRRLDLAGVDLATYFQVTGGAWGFTTAIDVTASPKYEAIDALMTAPRAALGIGTAVPGTVNVYTTSPRQGSGWGSAADQTIALNSNGFISFLVHAAAPGAFTLSFDARPIGTGTQRMSIWVGDRRRTEITLAGGTYDQTATAAVDLPAGLCAIRLQDESRTGTWTGFRHITFTATTGPANRVPQITAGQNLVVATGQAVRLAGAASDDGLPAPAALSLAWTQISGPATAVIGEPAATAPMATCPTAGTYVFRLTASDGALSASDDVQVVAVDGNLPPTVSVDAPDHAVIGTPAAIAATTGDDVGPVAVTWSVSGPAHAYLADDASASTSISFAAAGTYSVRATASDGTLRSFAERTVVVADSGGFPEISVRRSGAMVADGSTDAVGEVVAGSPATLTYIIANDGSAPLHLGTIGAIAGTNCAVVQAAAPASPLAVGGWTTLGLAVTPVAAGPWSFPVAIDTDDADEDPADWTVSGTAVDATAPLVSGMAVAVTTTTATVTWTTDEPATGQVAYGSTTAYGSLSEAVAMLSTSHRIVLTGLAAGTTYHAQVLGSDAAGNAATTSDIVFTTATDSDDGGGSGGCGGGAAGLLAMAALARLRRRRTPAA